MPTFTLSVGLYMIDINTTHIIALRTYKALTLPYSYRDKLSYVHLLRKFPSVRMFRERGLYVESICREQELFPVHSWYKYLK